MGEDITTKADMNSPESQRRTVSVQSSTTKSSPMKNKNNNNMSVAATTSTTTRVSVVGLPEDAVFISGGGGGGSSKKGAKKANSNAADDSSADDGEDIVVTIKENPAAATAAATAGATGAPVAAGVVTAASSSSPVTPAGVKKIITTTTTTTTTTIADAGAHVGSDDDDDDQSRVILLKTTKSDVGGGSRGSSNNNKKKKYRRRANSSISSSSSGSRRTARTAASTRYSSSSSDTSSLTGNTSARGASLSSLSSSGGSGTAAGTGTTGSWIMDQRRAEVETQKRILAERIRAAAIGLKQEQELAQQIRLAEADLKRQAQGGAAISRRSTVRTSNTSSTGSGHSSSFWSEKRSAVTNRQERIQEYNNNRIPPPPFAAAAAAAPGQQQELSYASGSMSTLSSNTNSFLSNSNSTNSSFLIDQKRAAANRLHEAPGSPVRSVAAANTSVASGGGATASGYSAASVAAAAAKARSAGASPTPMTTKTAAVSSGSASSATGSAASGAATVVAANARTASTSSGGPAEGLTTAQCVASPPPPPPPPDGLKPGAYHVPGFNYFGSTNTLDTGVNADSSTRTISVSPLRSLFPQHQSSSSNNSSTVGVASANSNNPDNNILCAELVDEHAMQLQAEQQAAVALQRMMDQAPVAQATPDLDDRAARLAQRKKKRKRKCIVSWTIIAVILVNITVAAVVAYGMGLFDNIGNVNKDGSTTSTTTTPTQNPSSFWDQIGRDIDGIQESESFGAVLAISADGKTLVASAPKYSGAKTGSGQVRAYYYYHQDDNGSSNNSTNSSTVEWKRLGQDLEGRLLHENFGSKLSLSPSGKLLAITSPGSSSSSSSSSTSIAGVVRVFGLSEVMNDDAANNTGNKTTFVWEQLGPDIISRYNSSWFGQSLSIMDNLVLAVGDVVDPTSTATNMNVSHADYPGRVLIFRFIASQAVWVPMGAEINAARNDTAFGHSLQLAINKSGTIILAVGAPPYRSDNKNDVNDDDENAPVGNVSIYHYDSTDVWIPFGSASLQGDVEQEQANLSFGAKVALSADGSMLVVGQAPMSNATTTTTTTVFHDVNGTGEWVPLDYDIEGDEGQGDLGNMQSLSANGKVLATTSRDSESSLDQVRIWDLIANEDGNVVWRQRGTTLPLKNQGDMFDYKVALSADGDRVAVSVRAWDEDGVETVGRLQVFEPNRDDQVPVRQAFTTTLELQTAVSDYLIANAAGEVRATKYGEKIGDWDVSSISNFDNLFDAVRVPGASTFNEDVSAWNVSSATSMSAMFRGALKFNQDLSAWDVRNVKNMSATFYDAQEFQADISMWRVDRVIDMSYLFGGALGSAPQAFNANLSSWNVSNVVNMASMFQNSKSFNQDLSMWDVSRVTNFSKMFRGALAFAGTPAMATNWNISSALSVSKMFMSAPAFKQDLCPWGPLLAVSNAAVDDMFLDSGCTEQSDPTLGSMPPGPLCAACTIQ